MSTSTSTISPQKLEANRANAKKSTGPRSAEGKARSRLNSMIHGLTARAETPLPDEERGGFARSLGEWMNDLKPADAAQRAAVEIACRAAWQLGRCSRFEDVLNAHHARRTGERHERGALARAAAVGGALLGDAPKSDGTVAANDPAARSPLDDPANFILLERYEGTANRAFHKAIAELVRLRKEAARRTIANTPALHDPEPAV